MGAISRPSNCSRGDAVHLWEATYVRKCLGSGGARGPDMHSEVSGPGKKRKPARCPRTGGAHSLKLYFTISLVGPGADHSLFLNPSPSLPPLSPFSFHSINFFFFNLIFFPLYRSPLLLLHHIHHQTLTSICCLPSISWLVIVFL